jgi:hypothetical protein
MERPVYSRLWNKYRGTQYQYLDFFPGAMFLIREGNAYFFQNIRYFMVWGMPILRATLNIFAKCSMGYVYSRGYIYSRV